MEGRGAAAVTGHTGTHGKAEPSGKCTDLNTAPRNLEQCCSMVGDPLGARYKLPTLLYVMGLHYLLSGWRKAALLSLLSGQPGQLVNSICVVGQY